MCSSKSRHIRSGPNQEQDYHESKPEVLDTNFTFFCDNLSRDTVQIQDPSPGHEHPGGQPGRDQGCGVRGLAAQGGAQRESGVAWPGA